LSSLNHLISRKDSYSCVAAAELNLPETRELVCVRGWVGRGVWRRPLPRGILRRGTRMAFGHSQGIGVSSALAARAGSKYSRKD
jgi:hypothetical protein